MEVDGRRLIRGSRGGDASARGRGAAGGSSARAEEATPRLGSSSVRSRMARVETHDRGEARVSTTAVSTRTPARNTPTPWYHGGVGFAAARSERGAGSSRMFASSASSSERAIEARAPRANT